MQGLRGQEQEHDQAIPSTSTSTQNPNVSPPDGLSKEVKEELRFQTFVFFDLEATGLPSDTRPPRITELCFKALDFEHFSALKQLLLMYKDSKNFEDILPRVANTLKLCFNPGAMVPEKVTDITG